MGNVFGKKKVADELESLSQQVKAYKDDIEKTHQIRISFLWYSTFLVFFLASAGTAYGFLKLHQRNHQIFLVFAVSVAALVSLIAVRRCVHTFYEWRINRKKKTVDDLLEKKKQLLSKVKETETFKVAKEILDKYEEIEQVPLPPPRPGSVPTTLERKGPAKPENQVPSTPASRGLPPRSGPNPMATPATSRPPPPTPFTAHAMRRPVRPFQKEASGVVEKVVDYFFSDGPDRRLALICSNCHTHNGMSLPHEYDYLAFVCYICGFFNPARKLRQIPLSATQSVSGSTTSVNEVPETPKKTEKKSDSEEDAAAGEDFDVIDVTLANSSSEAEKE